MRVLGSNRKQDWRPTWQQELLLRAALLRGDAAIKAWHAWMSQVDVELLDYGSHRLLPLLHDNLRRHKIEEPILGKLKGVYRQTWYKNQILFHIASEMLRSFRDAGIETLVLKGAALSLLYYQDKGLRPMQDFDLLVRPSQAVRAISLLSELKWRAIYLYPESLLPYEHGCEFEDSAQRVVDLHWRVMREGSQVCDDDSFWKDSVPLEMGGVFVRALNPADQLLHVCVHGAKWNVVPPVRWVADAMMIMRSAESNLDWDRLIEQAQKRRLSLAVSETLRYLCDMLNAPVPPIVLKKLREASVSLRERSSFSAGANPHDALERFSILLDWRDGFRSTRGEKFHRRWHGFIRYLQCRWEVESSWQVPFYALSKSAQVIWRSANRFTLSEEKKSLVTR